MADTYDPRERAREKQASRDEDERRLASGEVTREQLARENSPFHGLIGKPDFTKRGLPMSQHLPPDPPDLDFAISYAEDNLRDDDHQIRVWAFDRAPAAFQNLSTNGGDEDYVFYIPPGVLRDDGDAALYWIDNLDGGQRPQIIELTYGAQVRIVSHA